ncbi:monosaccharide ABC transporter ATP-binding protein, CUT2 family [Plantibacter flavus]|uniref:Monosaccharide ABC transporter ATP-binding protein (CUT2 family) n=1 Tax=Plantibacter flavus TaxID=150123 RepID=A0A3N2BYE7_9MICO|nr:sugar ABC transporter ATP-binding protein [Plantibacter flavus]ROR80278.1 monosaccharide ABC transporter ATP-binding protein (CUT2 family) [Plantibacter flavus]SMG35718.1 monosaccharide ABC transporter ATP-binding protein, CUT2 family [Plantibacter flavus]
MTSPTPLVQLRGVSVSFPGVKALDDVDLRLFPGEVHSLMGENGAGKSTLIKSLTGVHRIDSGSILLEGREVSFSSVADAQAHGISTVYQEVNLLPNLTVAENILLGREPRHAWGGISGRRMRERARELLAVVGLDIDPASQLSAHPPAIQQLVAIVRAIAVRTKVLVLDEPTSSLDNDEVTELFRVISILKAEGVAILFISHFLDQVYEISDRLTVLREGRLVGEYLPHELLRIDLVHKMIGKELATFDEIRRGLDTSDEGDALDGEDPFVAAIGLGRQGAIEPIDLKVYEGEIVGIAGLLGSGRTELARLLTGVDRADTGSVEVAGRATRLGSPRRALKQRIVYASENRRTEGIIGDLSLRDNIALALQADLGWFRRIPLRRQNELAESYIQAMGIKPANPDALMKELSGGNQQKVLLARWLALAPRLLVLDEPTRGIDIGAKAEIQKLVTRLAENGLSVVFISAELEEVLRISHRIAVLRDRRKVADLPNYDLTVSKLLAAISEGPDEAPPQPSTTADDERGPRG